MPEYAELHHSAHQVAGWAAGFTFTRALTRGLVPSKLGTVGVGDHDKAPLKSLDATEDWESFEIFARHRGKEVGLVLAKLSAVCNSPLEVQSPCCPTCDAIRRDTDGDAKVFVQMRAIFYCGISGTRLTLCIATCIYLRSAAVCRNPSNCLASELFTYPDLSLALHHFFPGREACTTMCAW